MTELNYFTCTLGQAAAHDQDDSFTNINDFIEGQAKEYAEYPAVGFFHPASDSATAWHCTVLTFKVVFSRSVIAADSLSKRLGTRQAVALLCPSTIDFLFTWLGLLRLGHSVLLVAPQCSPTAVAELCKQSNARVLFYDNIYQQLAEASKTEAEPDYPLKLLPLHAAGEEDVSAAVKVPFAMIHRSDSVSKDDIAYLFHTSGTSSGIPKPIPQTHYAGVGVCPRLNGSASATFTTTPLYHGGIADLFRGWTSRALVWLFPGKDAPITAGNIVKCLEGASRTVTPSVRYFSSVPYVLQIMAADTVGLRYLQCMDIVGVGGAALPRDVGDKLVDQGVNLVSRYGSAECGFLMSSHRDYKVDGAWQYLRSRGGPALLKFEEQESGLFELIVMHGWPHMSKTNRDDRSFATSDLFDRHPEIPDAWRYHSRADSQLTLSIGKKFDPAPIEAALAASSVLLQDVLVFGNEKPYPGALLFQSAEARDISNEKLLSHIAPELERVNKESVTHARISPDMLISMAYSQAPLEKSSKGTTLRSKAEERYLPEIEAAYNKTYTTQMVSDDQLTSAITRIVRSTTKNFRTQGLESQTDLFAYGLDSIGCIHIRHALRALLDENSPTLPMTIVQDAGTIQGLTDAILTIRHGKILEQNSNDDPLALMQHLVDHYSHLQPVNIPTLTSRASNSAVEGSHSPGKILLITGSTGTLGIHLLAQLLATRTVSHIHLLLRNTTLKNGKQRILETLRHRKLAVPVDFETKVTIHICNLSDHILGLAEGIYCQLVEEVDLVYHLAWAVDFTLPLSAFKQHFAGLQSLLDFAVCAANHESRARSHRLPRFIFSSSVAVVSRYSVSSDTDLVPERILSDPSFSSFGGYARSKWVAESMCHRMAQNYPELAQSVSVVRVGQLSGDTVHGIWNEKEAYPLILGSAKVTRCLPDFPGERLAWLPVDKAATAFVEVGLREQEPGQGSEVPVFHLLNDDRTRSWKTLLDWISGIEAFEVVSAHEWLQRLAELRGDQRQGSRGKSEEHPALMLLDFWKQVYDSTQITTGSHQAERPGIVVADVGFEMERTRIAMPALSDIQPVDRDYALRLWKWTKENV